MDTTKTRQQIPQVMRGTELRDSFVTSLGNNIAETLVDCGIAKTCLNCDHWNSDGTYGNPQFFNRNLPEGCKKYRALPPPKIIVMGCPDHTDALPF